MAKESPDLLQGTLDMLILKSLQLEPMHGFGISLRIRQMSDDVLQVEQGSLYPALYRLEERGWIKAEWGVSDHNRKARFYTLTAAGRKQLNAETSNWTRVSVAINLVLKGAPP
jgi:PadR family transcriptional regulator PadR